MSYLDNISSEKWDTLSYGERISTLQDVENHDAAKQCRIPRRVKAVELESDVRGEYNPNSPQYIKVNSNMVNQSGQERKNFELMSTVIHEGRHAYQDDIIRGRLPAIEESKDQVDSWAHNTPAFGGEYYDGKIFGTRQDYRYQPIEADAHGYAKKEMDLYQDRFSSDAGYKKYVAQREFSDGIASANAKLDYGENYEKAISNRVERGYKFKNQMKSNCQANSSCDNKFTKRSERSSTSGAKANKFTSSYGKSTSGSFASKPSAGKRIKGR